MHQDVVRQSHRNAVQCLTDYASELRAGLRGRVDEPRWRQRLTLEGSAPEREAECGQAQKARGGAHDQRRMMRFSRHGARCTIAPVTPAGGAELTAGGAGQDATPPER